MLIRSGFEIGQRWPDYPSLAKDIRRQLALSQKHPARELDVSYATVNRRDIRQSKPSKLAQARLDAFCKWMQAGQGC